MLSDKLNPLVEGVRQNKQHWLKTAGNIYSSNGTDCEETITDQDKNPGEKKRDEVFANSKENCSMLP